MVIDNEFETDVDYMDSNKEELYIRGKNLDDMIRSMDLIETIFHTLLKKKPDYNEKKILNAVLVSFHAGFDICPPTTMAARFSASTGADIAMALAAGYCSGGPYHVGAVKKSMEYYKRIAEENPNDLKQYVEDSIEEKLDNNLKIYGFGHPQFRKDPRPATLRGFAKELDYNTPYLEIYDIAKNKLEKEREIYPNVDGINAALLLSLGFNPEHGTALFLFSRTIGMIAHISEEMERKPFDVWYKTMGKIRYHKGED